MTAFSPSDAFAERWLATPMNIRQTIYQELDDIKSLLQSDDGAQSFSFSTAELDASLAQMHAEHTARLAEQNRLTAQGLKELHQELITQIDERVAHGIQVLSDDIKTWLAQTIADKIDQLQQTK